MEFLKNIFGNKTASKEVARDRLNLILIHDRSDISPELLNMIKGDIIKVISNYVEIDTSDLDVSLTNVENGARNAPALIASIPIKKVR